MKPAASRDRQREGLLARSYPQRRGKSDGHLLDKNGGGPVFSVSRAVAVRLGKLFGDSAGVWARMQAAYDTWNAERKENVRKTIRAKAA